MISTKFCNVSCCPKNERIGLYGRQHHLDDHSPPIRIWNLKLPIWWVSFCGGYLSIGCHLKITWWDDAFYLQVWIHLVLYVNQRMKICCTYYLNVILLCVFGQIVTNSWGSNGLCTCDPRQNFLQHNCFWLGRGVSKAWKVVWYAIVWSLWRHHNCIIFDNKLLDFDGVMEDIRFKA